MTDDDVKKVEGVVETLKRREPIDATHSPLATPDPVSRLGFVNSLLSSRADAETRFVSSMEKNVQAKIDYVRTRDNAKNIHSILESDKALRDGALAESERYRDAQIRLLAQAEKMDARSHERALLEVEDDIDKLKQKAANRHLSLDERLEKQSREKLAISRAKKLELIEEHKERREMRALIEDLMQHEIANYVKKVKTFEKRDVNPADQETWTERDHEMFTGIDDEHKILMDQM